MERFKMRFGDSALDNALGKIDMAESENGVTVPVMPDTFSLAMAYVPIQIYKDMYPVEEGFNAGTVYPELDKPFLAGGNHQ